MLDSIFGLSLKDKAAFFRQLATLIDSGMPFMGCLEALATSPNAKIRRIVTMITPMIQQGNSLSSSLSQFPEYFSEMTLMMIRAGEVGGQLEVRLKNIADYQERMYKLQQQLISKSIYPLVIVHAGIFIPTFPILILKGLVPYLMAVIIPLTVLYGGTIGLFVGYRAVKTIPGLREFVDNILINFPFIGGFFRASAVFRFTRVAADLFDAGVDIEQSITTAGSACGNAAAKERFHAIVPHIQRGSTITEALRLTKLFPEMVLQLIHTGEQAGSLSQMMEKAAEMLGQQLDEAINRLFAILPIFLFLCVAIYAGYQIITTFTKIYAPLFEMDK